MSRAIDADEAKRIARESLTDPYHVISTVAVIDKTPTLTPPNEPLTIEQLRKMDEPVWCACEPIEGGNGYWCLCRHGDITTPAGSFYEVEEIPHWTFFRRPPERQEDT